MKLSHSLVTCSAIALFSFAALAESRTENTGVRTNPATPAIEKIHTAPKGGMSQNPNAGEAGFKKDINEMRDKNAAEKASKEASKSLEGKGFQAGKGSALDGDSPTNKSAQDAANQLDEMKNAAAEKKALSDAMEEKKKKDEAVLKAMDAMACKQTCSKKYNNPYAGLGDVPNWGAALDSLDDTPEEKAAKQKAKEEYEAKKAAAKAKNDADIESCTKQCIAEKKAKQ